jgi:hypothetical protein
MSADYFIIYILLKIAVTCSRYTTIQKNIDIYNNILYRAFINYSYISCAVTPCTVDGQIKLGQK